MINNELKKINIGIDVGVSSVGWAIIGDDLEIIDLGVRLFEDVANPRNGKLKNDVKRSSRGLRRIIRRRALRKKEFINLIRKYKLVPNDLTNDQIKDQYFKKDITIFKVDNPIELKVKALKEKISIEEFLFILYHYLSHRGFFLFNKRWIKEIKKWFNPRKRR